MKFRSVDEIKGLLEGLDSRVRDMKEQQKLF